MFSEEKEAREELTKQGYNNIAIDEAMRKVSWQATFNTLALFLSVPAIMLDPDLGQIILERRHKKSVEVGRKVLEKYKPTPRQQILIAK